MGYNLNSSDGWLTLTICEMFLHVSISRICAVVYGFLPLFDGFDSLVLAVQQVVRQALLISQQPKGGMVPNSSEFQA